MFFDEFFVCFLCFVSFFVGFDFIKLEDVFSSLGAFLMICLG